MDLLYQIFIDPFVQMGTAPDLLVQQVIARLRELGALSVRKLAGVVETVHFPLPNGLGDKSMAKINHP